MATALNTPAQPNSSSNPTAPAQQGTGYVNLNSYIGANQNNQLGNTVAGGIEQAGTSASNALGAANNTFQAGAAAEQNRQAALGTGVTNTLNNVMSNGYTPTAADTTTFQNALSGQSQGPTGLNNAATLAQNAQNAQALGQSTTTQQGQYNLLQNYVGQGQQYGMGQQTLDSALLGATGASQLGQARQATANLGGQANQAINQAAATGTGLQNSAQQLATNTQNQLGTDVQSYQQMLASNLANAQAQTNAQVAALGGVNGNTAVNLSPAELQQLSQASGGVLSQGANLYNTDLANYVTANQQFANTQDIQTAQNLAQAQALQQLAGTNGLTGNNAALLNSYTANPSAVGTYASNNPFAVANQAALNNAIQTAASNYNGQLNPIQNMLSNDQSTMANIASQYNQQNPNGPSLANASFNPAAMGGQGSLAQLRAYQSGAGGNNPGLLSSVYGSLNNDANSWQNQINQLGTQFDINRILGVTPTAAAPVAAPAQSGSPIIGNGGQQLTS